MGLRTGSPAGDDRLSPHALPDLSLIAAYVSGHGFGHSTRVGEVLRAVRAEEPGLPLAVTTSAPEWLWRRALGEPLSFRARACDVGLVQRGALSIDEPGTLTALSEWSSTWEARVTEEAAWLKRSNARVVLGDVPPLAFAAAEAAGLPSLGLANFSWDWIYAHLARRQPDFEPHAEAARRAYASCGRLLRLPFAGDLSAFPRVEDVPLVARRPRRGRQAARRALNLQRHKVVLWSFGGLGWPGFDATCLAALPEYLFLLTSAGAVLPENARHVGLEELDTLGLDYADLVAAADVVVTKPGYGIVSDAVAAGTPVVYTDRGDFPEYPIMVAQMPRYLACAFVAQDDLAAGRLGPALASVLEQSRPQPPALDGAQRSARRLLETL